MNRLGVWGVLSLTFKDSIRAKWLILFSIVFFLLSIDIPDLLAMQTHILPSSYLATFLGTLTSLAFPVIPLLSLPMGATSIVDERESGTLQYILSNPISKSEFFLGRTVGLLLATTTAVIVGFGAAAVVSYSTNIAEYAGMVWMIIFAVALNAIMLGLGFIISEFSKRKVTALVIGIFTWLLFTALSSVDNLAVILNAVYGMIPAVALVMLDPIETSRLLTVLQLGENDSQWGNVGLFAYNYFHSNMYLALVIILAAWIVGLFAIGFYVFNHQDQG